MAVKKERERELSISLPTTGGMGLRQRTKRKYSCTYRPRFQAWQGRQCYPRSQFIEMEVVSRQK